MARESDVTPVVASAKPSAEVAKSDADGSRTGKSRTEKSRTEKSRTEKAGAEASGSVRSVAEPLVAATVVLLRDSVGVGTERRAERRADRSAASTADRRADRSAGDGTDGGIADSGSRLEVLLLERPRDRGSFAGAWVFPGGALDGEDRQPNDPADVTEEVLASRSALREVREETGLVVPSEALVTAACWTPPVEAARRFRTWFYWAAAPGGDVVIPPEEIVDYAWMRPTLALERHAAGELTLVPPTWVTLHNLARYKSVGDALAAARLKGPAHFATRIATNEQGMVFFWQGDAAHAEDGELESAGGRHRLEAGALPWVYSRSAAEND